MIKIYSTQIGLSIMGKWVLLVVPLAVILMIFVGFVSMSWDAVTSNTIVRFFLG